MARDGRNNQVTCTHYLQKRITFSNVGTSGVNIPIGVIPAQSVYLRATVAILTKFDGDAPALLVGGNLVTNLFVTTAAVVESVAAVYPVPAVLSNVYLGSDTQVFLNFAHTTAPTTGVAEIVLEFIPPLDNIADRTVFDTN